MSRRWESRIELTSEGEISELSPTAPRFPDSIIFARDAIAFARPASSFQLLIQVLFHDLRLEQLRPVNDHGAI